MKKIKITDIQQRELALNPQESFIVQAPAGSGKTTLLTLRFLHLLTHTKKNPEEILAITFTRKAAAEMRARIINTLQNCAENEKPTDKSAQLTWELANQALLRDKKSNWNLLNNPNRLRIQTIDSLCANLAQQMPLLSRFGSAAKLSNDQEKLYLHAARELLLQIDDDVPWANAIKNLLQHLDNRFAIAEKLLANMIAKRDQWLPYIHQQTISREALEQGLQAITEDCLEKLENTKPDNLIHEITELAEFAASSQHGVTNVFEKSSTIEPLDVDNDFTKQAKWLFVANLLLTKNDAWRKQVTKQNGFPAPSSIKDKQIKSLYKNMKSRMEELLQAIQPYTAFQETLVELKSIPPTKYSEQQWEILSSLTTLLPIAAAQLKLIFRETGEVDFTEVSQAALQALGSPDNPTDLTLNLDYKIQHILVDEFQDTSTTQFRLLELLTSGWENDDGRTLFIVGDPMQSIYRFRDAEVGLFLRARNEGIGNISLTPLTLTSNFRSDKKLITWYNETFADIFPISEDIASGAVSYCPSSSAHDSCNHSCVNIHPLIDADEISEAQYVVQLIIALQQKNQKAKIAVLVKARNHLKQILHTLRMQNIQYQAVEIDKLNSRPIIQDLLALTKALLHLADRISWLAILRAPWCGLTLEDLHIIANQDATIPIWQRINSEFVIKQLSKNSQLRLTNLTNILANALQNRGRHTLRIYIYDTWIQLNGPSCVTTKSELDDAKAYFDLLDTLESGGDIKDFWQLEEKVNSLFATADTSADDSLQIMTIHKAKGLEFDIVILPGLHHIPPKQEQQLLLWQERPRTHVKNDLILAPIKNHNHTDDKIYSYLARKERLKNRHEDLRLLYVATTRAKSQLHLLGNAARNTTETNALKPPPANSFLRMIWSQIQNEFTDKINNHINTKTSSLPYHEAKQIRRIILSGEPKIQKHTIFQDCNTAHQKILQTSNYAQHIGTVIHRILYQISIDGIEQWDELRIHQTQMHWRSILLQLGVIPKQLANAIQHVNQAIKNTITDQRGKWILAKHRNAKSEYAISTSKNNSLNRIIIDRTFFDENNKFWIIDYKTTNFNATDPEQFLEQEKEKYHNQLDNYARALATLYPNLDINKIHFGLYFPVIMKWIEWF